MFDVSGFEMGPQLSNIPVFTSPVVYFGGTGDARRSLQKTGMFDTSGRHRSLQKTLQGTQKTGMFDNWGPILEPEISNIPVFCVPCSVLWRER